MWLSDADWKFIYTRVPRICVDLIVHPIGSEKLVLLTFRDIEPHKGKWHLPGGGILFGESIEDAISRIAEKELGVKVSIGSFAGIMEFPSEYRGGDRYHAISLAFNVIALDELFEGNWFSHVPSEALPEHGVFLKDYFSKF